VRSRSQVNSDFMNDTAVMGFLNIAIRQFCIDAYGVTRDDFLVIAPRYDIDSAMALSFSVDGGAQADHTLTATDLRDQTMAQVAVLLKAAAEAACAGTTWTFTPTLSDTKGWYFVASEAGAATSLHIGSPADKQLYSDPFLMLFGDALEDQDTSWEGNFGHGSTMLAVLPSDCMDVKRVWWDEVELEEVDWEDTFNLVSYGDPSGFAVKESEMRFNTSPLRQAVVKIEYKSSGVLYTSASSQATVEQPVPTADWGIINHAAMQILENTNAPSKAQSCEKNYRLEVQRYITRVANQNTDTKKRGPRGFSFSPTYRIQT
jgi:hypothetical protein